MVGYFKALNVNIESIKKGPNQQTAENKMEVETTAMKRDAEEEEPFQVVESKKRPLEQKEPQQGGSGRQEKREKGAQPQKTPPQGPQDTAKLPRIPPVVLRKHERWRDISKGLSVAKIGYTKAKMVESTIQVEPATVDDHRRMTKFLLNNKEEYPHVRAARREEPTDNNPRISGKHCV